MDNFLYAMEKSFSEMQKEIHKISSMSKYTEKEKNELFRVVSSCLHSILDYAERLREEIRDEDKILLSAFRYANNSLKHCVLVKDITKQKGGITFPIHFPLTIPRKEIVWSIVNDENEKWANQRKNYEDFLKGKEVTGTCKNIIEILQRYNF